MSRTHIPAELRRSVRMRARDCCEYCLIPESMTLAAHEIDHVIAEKHGGPTDADNLGSRSGCSLPPQEISSRRRRRRVVLEQSQRPEKRQLLKSWFPPTLLVLR